MIQRSRFEPLKCTISLVRRGSTISSQTPHKRGQTIQTNQTNTQAHHQQTRKRGKWEITSEIQKTPHSRDRTRARQGQTQHETQRFGRNPRDSCRRWLTAESAVFSGQPGGAPPCIFSRIYRSIYQSKGLAMRISNIILSNPTSSYILWIEAKHFHEPNLYST